MRKHISEVLGLATLLLLIICSTDLGQIKIFRFLFGEMAMVTAIAFSFRQGQEKPRPAIWPAIVGCFLMASMSFVLTTWFLVR